VTTSFGIAVVSQAHVLVREPDSASIGISPPKEGSSLLKPPAPSFSNKALGQDSRAHSGSNACSDPWSLRIGAMKGCAARRLTPVRWLTFSRRQRDAPTLTDLRFDTVSAFREMTIRQPHRLVQCCLSSWSLNFMARRHSRNTYGPSVTSSLSDNVRTGKSCPAACRRDDP
jgi:hypothetical protein